VAIRISVDVAVGVAVVEAELVGVLLLPQAEIKTAIVTNKTISIFNI